jgi:transglutaminase-like putative cysteine protease
MFVIPTESVGEVTLPDDAAARVQLTALDAAQLAQLLGLQLPAGAESFEYVIHDYPQLEAAERNNWLEATFVIDHDQPVFSSLRRELEEQYGANPGREQIVEFVGRIIDSTVPRGWDFASTVARRRQGDCSEHAVLTTALARLYGLPARVAVGVALVSKDKEHGAYGHAWSEILEDGKWVVADATAAGLPGATRYVPMGLMENEGMGFTMGLAALTRVWITKVQVLGPAN